MHHLSEIFSNEGIEEVAELTAGTRDDNVALATAEGRAARRVILAGCTISLIDMALVAVSISAVE
ncbi:hypothetical protein ACLK1T_19825 [Escherichia coli]